MTDARIEHNKHTLLVHISDEDGRGWTTLAIDRLLENGRLHWLTRAALTGESILPLPCR